MKKKINDMVVELEGPNGLNVGDLIYCDPPDYRVTATDDCYRIYALTKRVVHEGETWFRARRVYPLGIDLKEDYQDIIIGGIMRYKILNI